jgi:DNA-binding transcriptional LysR family regulator
VELRAIEYFSAVVDHGGFTRAAAALGVAQPSLSEGVQRLERELETTLFERAGRTVRLTVAGEALLGPARQLLRDRDAALDAVAAVRELRSGALDLVALPTLVAEPLASLIGRFRSAHPGVSIHIADPEDDAALARRVATGQSELGLTELPPRDDTLVTIRLEEQEIVAVCPPGTVLARAGRLAVAELTQLPFITTPPGTSTRDLLDRALASARVQPTIAVETSQREAIGPLVLDGAGVGFLPRASADHLASRGAVIARLSPPLTRVIGLVHRAVPLGPAARAFVEMARPARPERGTRAGGRAVRRRS